MAATVQERAAVVANGRMKSEVAVLYIQASDEAKQLQREVSLLRQQLAGEKEAYQFSDRIATERMHKAEAKVELVKGLVANEVPGTVVWTDHAGFDAHQYAAGDCAAAFRAGETAGRVKFAREIEAVLTGVQRKILL